MSDKFDLNTHVRNKEGKVIRANPYRMVVDRQGQRFERPPGSGKWFYPDGTEAPEVTVAAKHGDEVRDLQGQIELLKKQLEANSILLASVDAKKQDQPDKEKKG